MPEPTENSRARDNDIARLRQLRERVQFEIDRYKQLGDSLAGLHALLLEQVVKELEALIEKLSEAVEQDQDHPDPAMQELISRMEIQVQSTEPQSALEKLKFPASPDTENKSRNEK